MKLPSGKVQGMIAVVVLAVVYFLLPEDSHWKKASTWQSMASPGDLSLAHADLETDCAACHTSVQGVDDQKCILCHANNQGLLQRQPTSFHSNVGSCQKCHREHLGLGARPTEMSHDAIARIGLEFLGTQGYPGKVGESALACDRCHLKQDQHFGLMGADCGQCHTTDMWTLPKFRHPSPQSRDCAQCHQAPPSHYMGHFKMISAKIAQKPHATVDQCFECHRTTAWTDIPGVGQYKHH